MAQLLDAHELDIDEIALRPGSGGVFEVEVDGTTLFSKAAAGRHAEDGEVLRALDAHLAAGA